MTLLKPADDLRMSVLRKSMAYAGYQLMVVLAQAQEQHMARPRQASVSQAWEPFDLISS